MPELHSSHNAYHYSKWSCTIRHTSNMRTLVQVGKDKCNCAIKDLGPVCSSPMKSLSTFDLTK